MHVTDLKGMTVVSLQEGTKLGQVAEPLVDVAARQLGALQVNGDNGPFIVPFAQIRQIGADAITVASSLVAQTASNEDVTVGLLDLKALGKLKVVDQDGTFLGRLSTVEVDPNTGRITTLTAHKGGVLGMGGTTTPIPSAAVVMVGAELVTVTADPATEPASPH